MTATDLNEDWLKARSWDLPTDVKVLEQQLGRETMIRLLDLPAGAAMPAKLRRAIEKLRDGTKVEPGLQRRTPRILGKAEWDESLHPRDHGKFTEAGGGDEPAESSSSVPGTAVGTTGIPAADHLAHAPIDSAVAAEVAAEAAELPGVHDPLERAAALDDLMVKAVANGQETQALYDHLGNQHDEYTLERQAAHQEIIDKVFADADARGVARNQEAVMMGGLPGSGKTYATSDLFDPEQFLEVNPDPLKQMLVDAGLGVAPAGVMPMEAAALTHEESSYLSKAIAERAVAGGYNVLWDGTMNSARTMTDRFALIKEISPDYHITGIFVHAPVEQSIKSVVDRYARGLANDPQTARYVRSDYIRATATPDGPYESSNRAIFEQSKGEFDQWVIVDNTDHAARIDASSPGAIDPGSRLTGPDGSSLG